MHKFKIQTKQANLLTPINSKGFTLVELLVTVIILTIVIISMGGMYYITQTAEIRSLHYNIAVLADRTEIESLRNNGYDSLAPGSTINFTSSLPSQLPANKSGTVTVSQPTAGLRQVVATVTYTEFNQTTTIMLTSDIGIIGIGQG